MYIVIYNLDNLLKHIHILREALRVCPFRLRWAMREPLIAEWAMSSVLTLFLFLNS